MRQHISLWIVIGLMGAFGALARYAVWRVTARWEGHFPWGTFLVNVSGCFFLGFLAAAVQVDERFLPPVLRTAVTVGFLGALTTFSTFGLETMERMHHGLWDVAATNVVANLALGLTAVWVGQLVARWALGSVGVDA